mmetsp:Transcript_40369/g.73119  ORF Transcript_40369/g.73119 Transcript_40369/m.73119 type:complete len:669 (+) Transcript_40369:68-2074(+)
MRAINYCEGKADSESGSASDTDAETNVSIWVMFKSYRVALMVSLVGEILFCYSMTTVTKDYLSRRTDFLIQAQHARHIRMWADGYWAVFVTCLVARLVLILLWKHACPMLHGNGKLAAVYIFFSTIQWVYYVVGYYVLMEALSVLTWKTVLLVAEKGNPQTSECLKLYSPLECRFKINEQMTCTRLFDPDDCAGYTLVSEDTGSNPVKCCNRNNYSLGKAVPYVRGLGLRIELVFAILQWLAALSMRWILTQNPMLPDLANDAFIKGVTLDILDAVIFGQLMLNDRLLFPKKGIRYDPPDRRGLAGPTDGTMYTWFFYVWVVGFVLAVVAPAIYTFFKKHEVDRAAVKPRTYADAVNDLMRSLRLLSHKQSSALVDEALELQRADYVKQSEGVDHQHPVRVHFLDGDQEDDGRNDLQIAARRAGIDAGFLEEGSSRPGLATLSSPGFYNVLFTDGEEPTEEEDVVVTRLQADLEQHAKPFNPDCCKGWGDVNRLRGNFAKKADITDAFRSLFFLELPFLLGRLYILRDSLSFDSFFLIPMMKNLVWASVDLLTLLSCGNENATACGAAPLKNLMALITGTGFSSVFVGPAGLFSIATQFTTAAAGQAMEAQKNVLNVHRAWVVVERERVQHQDPKAGKAGHLREYDKELASIDHQLEEIDKAKSLNHA